jgi:hypothetical protein
VKITHIIVSDSFTKEARAVAVNYSTAAERANFAALLREYRRNGFKVRTLESGSMYRAESPAGYHVNVWIALPGAHRLITALNIKSAVLS